MDVKYTLDRIKFSVDEGTWVKAVGLYEGKKIKNFRDTGFTFTANVEGTHLYTVIVSKKRHTDGDCTCHLGQNDILCKHMIAVGIHGLKKGKPLTEKEKIQQNEIIFSGKTGEINQDTLRLFRTEISGAMRYIKAYTGPSRIWFAYQDSLTEGRNRLSVLLSRLPANRQTAKLVVNLLLRLDKKLTTGGVDDSDGTVGGFIEEAVKMLIEFAKTNPECIKEFENLKGRETCFGWEEPLLKLL